MYLLKAWLGGEIVVERWIPYSKVLPQSMRYLNQGYEIEISYLNMQGERVSHKEKRFSWFSKPKGTKHHA